MKKSFLSVILAAAVFASTAVLSAGCGAQETESAVSDSAVTEAPVESSVDTSESSEPYEMTNDEYKFEVNDTYIMIEKYLGDDVNVVIPDTLEGLPVTKIDSTAFDDISDKLESLTIPDGVTGISYATFRGYTNLKSITIPDSVTNINEQAFAGCDSLVSIEAKGVTYIGERAFDSCDSLKSAVFSDSLTKIDTFAFDYCRSLEDITLPDSVEGIGAYAFNSCESLKNVEIPSSCTRIRDNSFSNCTSLESVTIPDSIKYIDPSAFSGCTSLESVTIPESVTNIYSSAFNDCADNFTIFGYSGSSAETFAKENNIAFSEIS